MVVLIKKKGFLPKRISLEVAERPVESGWQN